MLCAGLWQTQEKPVCDQGLHGWFSPHSCLLVSVADPKRSQDNHVTSLSSPERAAHSHLLPQDRGLEARVNSCIFGECQGPILKAEPGPGRGK